MAIKIQNTTVIDDNKQFIPVTISAGSTTGTNGQILKKLLQPARRLKKNASKKRNRILLLVKRPQ